MNKGKVNYWTKEEDELIVEHMKGVNNSNSLTSYLRKYNKLFSARSHASVYQRVLYVKFMTKKGLKISYRKPGIPLGTVRGAYKQKVLQVGGRVMDSLPESTSREIALPQGMSLDFTGKRITISDTYIKIYI